MPRSHSPQTQAYNNPCTLLRALYVTCCYYYYYLYLGQKHKKIKQLVQDHLLVRNKARILMQVSWS